MVGYGEMDLNGRCKISSLLNYLQEVATLHSKKYGYGTEEMHRLKMGWLLLSWKVKVIKYPLAEEEIEIKTWSRGYKGLHAMRGYEVYNNECELIVIADSNWVLYDLENQKPLKVLPEMEKVYGTIDRKPFEDDSVKIIMPSDYCTQVNYEVLRSDIDTNQHVNNVKYVELALDGLPDDVYKNKIIDNFEIVYKKQVFYKDKLKITCSKVSEDTYINAVINQDGDVCTILKSMWSN
jgi:medium-chain acyl-[acyl-carrier-protein] hydrolase